MAAIWANARSGLRKVRSSLGAVSSIITIAGVNLGTVGDLIARSAFLLDRDQIDYLDDLKRVGEGLKARDVLGLISYLKEEQNCSVALLLNDESMIVKDRDDFQRLLEKVIDVSVTFSPTFTEAALIALSDSDPISQQIRSHVETLAITNIRVIRKIATLTRRLSLVLKGASPEITKRAVRSVTLAGWAVLEPDRAPTISDLRLHNSIGNDRHEKGDESRKAAASTRGRSGFLASGLTMPMTLTA